MNPRHAFSRAGETPGVVPGKVKLHSLFSLTPGFIPGKVITGRHGWCFFMILGSERELQMNDSNV